MVGDGLSQYVGAAMILARWSECGSLADGHSTLDAQVMQVDHMHQVRGRRLPNGRRSQSTGGPSGP
jgi:hypothetical protein